MKGERGIMVGASGPIAERARRPGRSIPRAVLARECPPACREELQGEIAFAQHTPLAPGESVFR